MRKYHATVVHRSQDALGIIEVVDAGYSRSLHFGNALRQSAMDLSRPQHLVLNYTRAMMSGLLFRPSPRKILLIGLGGGSLAKFILHHFPRCTIDAIEHRELVVKLAYGFFLLPEDRRLLIHIADGAEFVQRMAASSSSRYDLILVDAYNNAGMDDRMGEATFINNCYALLDAEGLLVINLWGRDQPIYNRVRRILQQCFAAKPLLLPSEGTTNVIAMATSGVNHKNLMKSAERRAGLLEQQTGLELVRFYRTLRKHNDSLLKRIFH